jgi:hypothetical protein
MTRKEVGIINPKANRLLEDLADMDLITIKDIPDVAISKPLKNGKGKSATKPNQDFLDYLLSGPVMTDEEFNDIKEKRKHFNKWK